jgi:hypothetical protein
MELPRPPNKILNAVRSRLLVPALVALVAGIGGVIFGLSHDDIVTALGALLFIPSALLLFGIAAKRREIGPLSSSNQRAN